MSAPATDPEAVQGEPQDEAPVEPTEAQGAPGVDEHVPGTDVEVIEPSEWTGGPEESEPPDPGQQELPNMPAPPWMPQLDGHKFRHVVVAFSGGVDFDITTESDSRRVKALKLDRAGELSVRFRVKGKGHTVVYDKDGLPVKALKITLEVDSIDDWEE
jgi:hypothetical protein